jgi:hypothetical protein
MQVVNVENTDSSDYIYIGRSRRYGGPTKWGNPYKIGKDGTRDEVVAMYEAWLLSPIGYKHEGFPFSNKELMEQIPEIRAKNLGCHCAPLRCHGDLLIKLANNNTSNTNSQYSCYYCK